MALFFNMALFTMPIKNSPSPPGQKNTGGETLLSKFDLALTRAEAMVDLKEEDILALIEATGAESRRLFALADRIRCRFLGGEVYLRGIVEFSNHCSNNCLYCGLRRDNRYLKRYRMGGAEIIEAASRAAGLGLKTVVLQSGEDRYFTANMLAGIIYIIKGKLNMAVTLSLGDLSRKEYKTLRDAGADRYLLKHETSDAGLFSYLRPGTSLGERLKRLYWLKELGYQTGSGNMVGLPGQSKKSMARDLALMREIGVKMAGIGPFVANPDTPLCASRSGDLGLTLKVLAAARVIMPWAHLPATTATGTVDPRGLEAALACGANVVMPNMTPLKYRDKYVLYPGRAGASMSPEQNLAGVREKIFRMGRKEGAGYGHGTQGDLSSRPPVMFSVPGEQPGLGGEES